MTYKKHCDWCKKEFETDEIEQDHCSVDCFHAEQDDIIKQMDWEWVNR